MAVHDILSDRRIISLRPDEPADPSGAETGSQPFNGCGDDPRRAARIATAMEPYLRLGDQHLSGAEWSVPVDTNRWAKYLADFPEVTLAVENGRISRTALLGLAEQARHNPGSETYLNLFWNVLAWGIAGNWRNVGRITASVAANPQRVSGLLADAARASYAGEPREAHRIVSGQVAQWGSAFFTKYLHFTADTTDVAKTQCLILDKRVRVAWRCFAGEWLDLHSATHYQRYCKLAGEIARRRGSEPAWIEGRLYHFGRRVGSYEEFADTQLGICRQRLGTGFPTAGYTWQIMTGA